MTNFNLMTYFNQKDHPTHYKNFQKLTLTLVLLISSFFRIYGQLSEGKIVYEHTNMFHTMMSPENPVSETTTFWFDALNGRIESKKVSGRYNVVVSNLTKNIQISYGNIHGINLYTKQEINFSPKAEETNREFFEEVEKTNKKKRSRKQDEMLITERGFHYEKVDTVKTIAGYSCNLLILVTNDPNFKEAVELWYTEAIKTPISPMQTPDEATFKGACLELVYYLDGEVYTSVKAIAVEPKDFSDAEKLSLFDLTIPEGFANIEEIGEGYFGEETEGGEATEEGEH